jgi:LuxR family maltose regulon positive regulatory protein
MTTALLTTKLYIPSPRPNLVPRPRLLRRLDEGLSLEHKLTVISAPAGFGKTTLLSEWAAGCGRPVAWVSLDKGDNDPARFLSYFVAALAFLLNHLPPQMHLVIATRADPPLPIARLRARGQLTELRLTDLRFTLDEAAEFLNQVMGLELSADDVAVLASRTEGWVSGLQMAAVSMQGREDAARFIQAFTGSDRYILDYLLEEVLHRQPDGIQTFLLQTAILDRLTAPLCDAVIGDWRLEIGDHAQYPISNLQSQTILEHLESSNLFIVPLDNERRWYRYHRLFADLLRQRLHQRYPELVLTLHSRASEWHECNGLMTAAIDHALSAEDFERAAALVEQVAEATLMRSEVVTFLSWMEALPDELVRVRPSLCVFHAWALFLSGRSLAEIESRLQGTDRDADLIPSKAAPLRSWIAIFQGQLSRATELAHQALEELPEDDLFLRSIAAWTLSLSSLTNGGFRAGSQALTEIVRMSQDAGNVMIAVATLSHLAKLHVRQGQLHKANAIYERALRSATDKRGRNLPIAGEALMGLGDLWREWNDLEAASRYLVEGIELTKQWSEVGALDGYIPLARVRQAQGDVDGALDAIQTAEQLAIRSKFTEMDDLMVALCRARLRIAQGDIEAATRWAEEQGLALSQAEGLTGDAGLAELKEGDDLISYRLRKYEHLVLARLLIARKQPDDALALLEPLLLRMEQRERVDLVIEIQILRALAFQAQGNVPQALAALERALSLAEPGGFVRIFVDEGPPMAQLLYQAAAQGITPEYTGRLLQAFPVPEAKPPSPGLPAEMIEPLTERELDVLRLIAEGLSNQEIAQQLFLALPTVKWHTSNIYGKLAVKNRTQAVAKARALGILPTT